MSDFLEVTPLYTNLVTSYPLIFTLLNTPHFPGHFGINIIRISSHSHLAKL